MENKDSVSRDTALCEFICKMTEPTVDIAAEYESLIEELEGIYLIDGGGVHRHSYARLSHYLYDNDVDNDAIDICLENLRELKQYILEQDQSILLKALRKLEDHIDLESIHIGQLRKLKMSMSGTEKLLEEYPNIAKSVKETETSIKAANKAIEEQTVQSISILGIFAGVVFAFSGGFSMLSSTLSNIHLISGKQTVFFLAATLGIGCILYDVVFALMMFIGRYCNKEPQHVFEFTKVLNLTVVAIVVILMIIYCLCYNGDIRLVLCT